LRVEGRAVSAAGLDVLSGGGFAKANEWSKIAESKKVER
jgi:hypothetical protein